MNSPTPVELLERARKLRPFVAERAREADRLRQLPQPTLDQLLEAQLFEIMAPRCYGGHELDLGVLLEAAAEIGRGCGSTAWVLALLGIHNWMFGLFPKELQDEVFEHGAPVLAPATFAPGGTLECVEGGFRLNGRWMYGSGAQHSSWAMVSCVVDDREGGAPDIRCIALPISDVRVEDTWHTSGMRGTGSHDLVIEDVFVPEHRAISFAGLLDGGSPGAEIHESRIYRLPLVPVLSYVASAPALGMARGAVDLFRERTATRLLRTGEAQIERSAAQIRLAEASLEVESAQLLVRRGVEELAQRSRAGEGFSLEDRARFRMEACYATALCKRAIDRVALGSGAGAQFEDCPLQRFQRDINTLVGHVIFDFDGTAELYGRVLLGLPPNHPLI